MRYVIINNKISNFNDLFKSFDLFDASDVTIDDCINIISSIKNIEVFNLQRKVDFTLTKIQKLFEEVAPKFAGQNGGYTRVLKTYNRKGDNATMAIITLL